MYSIGGSVERQDSRFYPAAYPLKMDLQYRLVSPGRRSPVSGCGRTIVFGSREVVFAGDQSIPANASVQLSICWPVLLDDRIRLQLVIEGRVTSVEGGTFTVRIGKYHFRTRGSALSAAGPERQSVALAAIPAIARVIPLAAHA